MNFLAREDIDPADVDDDATDDDRKAADKNIIIQLKRLVSLNRDGEIKFENKKKEKVTVKIARKALTQFNKFRKPKAKEFFQNMAKKSLASLNQITQAAQRGDIRMTTETNAITIRAQLAELKSNLAAILAEETDSDDIQTANANKKLDDAKMGQMRDQLKRAKKSGNHEQVGKIQKRIQNSQAMMAKTKRDKQDKEKNESYTPFVDKKDYGSGLDRIMDRDKHRKKEVKKYKETLESMAKLFQSAAWEQRSGILRTYNVALAVMKAKGKEIAKIYNKAHKLAKEADKFPDEVKKEAAKDKNYPADRWAETMRALEKAEKKKLLDELNSRKIDLPA